MVPNGLLKYCILIVITALVVIVKKFKFVIKVGQASGPLWVGGHGYGVW